MNVQKVTEELGKKYPEKNIIVTDVDGYEEVLCELDPTSEHKERSLAIVVVGKSKEHYHKKTTEIYGVLKGKLVLYVDNEKYVLKVGQKKEIKPGCKHWCRGKNAWFYTYSTPGWTSKDHYITK
jgi:quercetin dioxygenase-like cupin family protein